MTTSRPPAVAIIPARGGSKGIPLKNLQKVGGRTLLARAIDAARGAHGIGRVVVSTDHDGIAQEAERAGAQVVHRPDDISGDTASSESALIHALDALGTDAEITVFLQCTSPFIDSASLDSAISRVKDDHADVVFSAVEDHSFLWKLDPAAHAEAVGHDAAFRPRRQDRDPHFNETGAFYVMRTEGLRASGHRFFGRIEIEEVPLEQSREIDSMSDLTLVRAIAASQEDTHVLDVDALVTDFDGVHTDDSAFVDQDGREFVRVHRGDGMGVGRLADAGFPFLILSKERNPVVTRRAEKLRVDVLQGIDEKAGALAAWIAERGLDPERVAYVGNDINDLAAFSVVGWPIAVADAHPKVLAAARFVLHREGGQGAVREVCDLIPASTLAKHAAP
ncbi:acylneuraminate cytidylyltransferase [Brevibacterium yomogidense]|uniref:acylneuraminate cytidylyltransferase n=1 Tax=Brevibacterium yomogidense TaxID=946573 RepID=UPI0018DF2F6F|nr:acylneuraminate cytidylyltransferase [Brevibacterium yomogidense]